MSVLLTTGSPDPVAWQRDLAIPLEPEATTPNRGD